MVQNMAISEIPMQSVIYDQLEIPAFWCEKLESGHDYTMYPQLTETVDVSMPIEISPKPDTFIRIWFVFVKDDTPQQLAKITPFERNGFTAVEWGGLFLN